MNVPATLKHSFLLCLFAAAVPLRAIPAPMQVTASPPARVWTAGDGTGNGRLGIHAVGVVRTEPVVRNEASGCAKKK
ncbi:hypothetical protein, partial [Akkermansia sp.]|uniref:hypothetical protein n=1 Tax=Akkermansia sp. TaxID=1872421 RepID=UPI00258A8AA8